MSQTSDKTPAVADSTQPRPGMAPPDVDFSGRQLGDYRLLRRLGRGGMAEVYLAEQLSLKRQVALKVLRADLAENEDYVRRFHNEAQAAAALVHANIVQIHEVGEIEGVHFIAQEYVQGKNLREYLDRHGAADVRLALHVARQVAAALLRAAQQGIVHRDIKPENVLLSASGEAKVADFGLAHVLRDGEQLNLTQVGVTMGTPLYMSPEQAEGKPLDHRSDLYSLGVTLYHALAGQPPFRGESALALAVQHLKSAPEPLASRRPDLPEGLCRIVHRLLEKDPAKRYESARELLRDLRLAAAEALGDSEDDDELWRSLGAELAGPMEATRRLNDVMKTAALVRHRPAREWLWLSGGLAAALVLGAACVWAVRPAPLLPGTAGPYLEVPRQKSAEAQYIYAGLAPTKGHWQAVIDYKPYDEFYALLAKKELALLHLQDDEHEVAGAIFQELAGLPEFEKELRAFGIGGQAVIDSLEGRHADALAGAQQVWDVLAKGEPEGQRPEVIWRKLDRRMREALWHAVQISDPKNASAWVDWLSAAFSGQETPPGEPKRKTTAPKTGPDAKGGSDNKVGPGLKPPASAKTLSPPREKS
jgi:serine/threonine-protein kinase